MVFSCSMSEMELNSRVKKLLVVAAVVGLVVIVKNCGSIVHGPIVGGASSVCDGNKKLIKVDKDRYVCASGEAEIIRSPSAYDDVLP